MKITLLLLAVMLGVTLAYPVTIADNEDDIRAFMIKHKNDTSVLFFVNQESQEASGFWATIFNLFGSTTESDESFLTEIAENNPVMKIDIGKTTLAHSTEDYKVESVPLAIAFHHGVEIIRERPTAKTADNIDNKVKEIEEKSLHEINHANTVHPERDPSKTDIWDTKTENDVHHHPAPLIVIPDFGHLSINDPSESSLIKSRPIQILDDKTGANIIGPIKIDQDGDMLIRYKEAQDPKAEDLKATAVIASQPKVKPTDGRRDIPVSQSAPRQQASAPARPASTSTRQSGSSYPSVSASHGARSSTGTVQRMINPNTISGRR
jgi:hypothetical protein